MAASIWKFLQSEAPDYVVGPALLFVLGSWGLVLAVTVPVVAGQ